jgi:hypothetical protein
MKRKLDAALTIRPASGQGGLKSKMQAMAGELPCISAIHALFLPFSQSHDFAWAMAGQG